MKPLSTRVVLHALLLAASLAASCASLFVTPAAAKTLTVEGVVSPAWVERAGKREPLKVGMELRDKDRVITGERARAMLRMSEGSAVKLGENATLGVDGLADSQRGDIQVVKASLDVVKGAFRFTTGIFGKPRAERDVGVKFGTVTAGVRGTDLWGRSIDKDDLVCLLEGKISVQHAKKEFEMNEPLQFFVVPRNEPAKPVGKIAKTQIDEWSRDTEITEGLGATRAGANMKLEVARFADEAAARAFEGKLKDAGYPAVIDPISNARNATDSAKFAVCVDGVAGARDRSALSERLKPFISGLPAPTPTPAAPAKNY